MVRYGPLRRLVSAGIELEDDARDLHVVARLEARGLERLDHAERAEALLHVAERLVVLHVVAGDQPLDALTVHPERARAGALDAVRLAPPGAVGAVGGGRVGGRLLRRLRRDLPEDRVRQLVE